MTDTDIFRFDAYGRFVAAYQDDRSSTVELIVAGPWSRDPWLEAHRLAHKCVTSHPAGLLLNLLRLDDPSAASTPLWFAVEAHGHRMTPVVPVVACVRDDSPLAMRMARLGAGRRLATFPEAAPARAALSSGRPLTDEIRLDLPPEPRSATLAGEFAVAACDQWDLGGVAQRARLVVAELVGNAVEHAGTEIHLIIGRLGTRRAGIGRRHCGLRLAVYDRIPRLPPLPHGSAPQLRPSSGRGQGLHIVDAAAEHWGALPTGRGKMVWAILRDRQPATGTSRQEAPRERPHDV